MSRLVSFPSRVERNRLVIKALHHLASSHLCDSFWASAGHVSHIKVVWVGDGCGSVSAGQRFVEHAFMEGC